MRLILRALGVAVELSGLGLKFVMTGRSNPRPKPEMKIDAVVRLDDIGLYFMSAGSRVCDTGASPCETCLTGKACTLYII